jgi:hypothetical protein
MAFKAPEGATLKKYEDPAGVGWYAWIEDADGTVLGYVKTEDSKTMVTVAEVEAEKKKAAAAKAKPAPKASAPKKGGKGARRRETNPEQGAMPSPGGRPSLHTINLHAKEQRKRLEETLGDPLKRPFKTLEEAHEHSARVHTEATRRLAEANKEARAILDGAAAEAGKILAAAKADAELIRKGAKAEAAAR